MRARPASGHCTAALPGVPLALVGRAHRPVRPKSHAIRARAAQSMLPRSAPWIRRQPTGRAVILTSARGMTRVNLLLLFALIACALSLVTSRHQARRVYVELERAQAKRGYETEYGQLQLEQSTGGCRRASRRSRARSCGCNCPSAARTEIVAVLPGTKEPAR
jgi:cell division protein FtsL